MLSFPGEQLLEHLSARLEPTGLLHLRVRRAGEHPREQDQRASGQQTIHVSIIAHPAPPA